MAWIILALINALLLAVVAIIDKIIIDDHITKPTLATSISAAANGLFFIISALALISGSIFIDLKFMILAIVTGCIHMLAVYFYYAAMQKDEVSRVTPIFALMPVFVTILSFYFLQESFSGIIYLGIILIIAGSILISLKKSSAKIKLSLAFFLAISGALFFAIKNVLFKYAAGYVEIYAYNFWFGIGALGIMIVFLLISGMPKTNTEKKATKFLFSMCVISALAFVVLTKALEAGPASLVTAMMQTKLAIVFFMTIILTVFLPRFFKERITKKILIQKAIAITMIIVGAVLIIQ